MNALKRIFATALLAIGVGSSASAEIITHTVDPLIGWNINSYVSVSYLHDLRPQGLPGPVINSASLSIYLYDATDVLRSHGETVSFRFDGIASPQTVSNVSLWGQDYTFGINTAMLDDGMLWVSLNVGCDRRVFGVCTSPQDVMFARSVLTADITRASDVPEPATLLTLGAGLLGLGAARRRRRA